MPSRLSLTWSLPLYLAICLPMLILLVECIRGAYCDFQMIHTAALRSEIGNLRSQSIRRAGNLEALLESRPEPENWEVNRTSSPVVAFWRRLEGRQVSHLYTAVVDPAGVIVMHSNPALLDKRLEHGWYDRRVPEAGDDVVQLDSTELSGGLPAYDVSVPIWVAEGRVGDFHAGLDATWFEARLWPQQRKMLLRWGGLLALALLVDGVGLWSLIIFTQRNGQLLNLVKRGIHDQARLLAQIGGGLAHQIRNPLHALRINLHILKRTQHGQQRLCQEQIEACFRESDAEIDTLDRLMRDLLQFAIPNAGTKSEVEIKGAVLAVRNLLDEEFRRQEIEIHVDLSDEPLTVAIDPTHLRQAISNLLAFAQLNTPAKGQIEISLIRRGRRAELTVGHSGPSWTKQELGQIFEPFQSPRESGSGLELSLVQCVALEAGGSVTCEKRVPSGNRFRVSLPIAEPQVKE